ncbi:MAG: DUF2339 domain-containing protein [Parachlamydiales bacterium]|nr:DUF2339 domain-containing protein [Parachlamydiales bacterium]
MDDIEKRLNGIEDSLKNIVEHLGVQNEKKWTPPPFPKYQADDELSGDDSKNTETNDDSEDGVSDEERSENSPVEEPVIEEKVASSAAKDDIFKDTIDQNVFREPKVQRPASKPIKLFEHWPAKLGILLVLLGISWGLHYAYTNDWFSPMVQFIFSLSVGSALFGSGAYFMKNKPAAGKILSTLGSSVLILTFWFAEVGYHILSPNVALGCMWLVISLQWANAIVFKSQSLAIQSTVIALVIPYLITDMATNYMLTLMYYTVLNVAALLLFYKGWAWPSTIAFIGMQIYKIDFLIHSSGAYATYFAVLLALMYVPLWITLGLKDHAIWKKYKVLGYIVTFLALTDLVSAGYIDSWFVAHSYLSYFIALTVVLTVTAFVIRMNDRENRLKVITAIIGLHLIYAIDQTLTMSMAIDEVTLRYIEFAVMMYYSIFMVRSPWLSFFASHAVLLLVAASFYPDYLLFTSWYYKEFWILPAGFLASGLVWYPLRKSSTHIPPMLGIVSIGYGIALIWNVCHQFCPTPDVGRGLALVIYTAIGVTLVVINKGKTVRRIGFAFILGVVVRLLLVEVWEMPILARIGTFLATGILLVATSFFDRKKGSAKKQAPQT